MPMPRLSIGTRCRAPGAARQRPASVISPASGVSSPARSRSVVVLPQPEGPSSVKNSPGATVKLIPFTTASVAVTLDDVGHFEERVGHDDPHAAGFDGGPVQIR